MLEHCITFFKGEPDEETSVVVFHCHVTAPDEVLAVEVALRETVNENVSLVGATSVEVRARTRLPPGLVDAMEDLRRTQHGTTVAVQQASSHLH
jgi:hypothetical protein